MIIPKNEEPNCNLRYAMISAYGCIWCACLRNGCTLARLRLLEETLCQIDMQMHLGYHFNFFESFIAYHCWFIWRLLCYYIQEFNHFSMRIHCLVDHYAFKWLSCDIYWSNLLFRWFVSLFAYSFIFVICEVVIMWFCTVYKDIVWEMD